MDEQRGERESRHVGQHADHLLRECAGEGARLGSDLGELLGLRVEAELVLGLTTERYSGQVRL